MPIQPLAKPIPRAHEKEAKRKVKVSKQREVYAFVNKRDRYRCRACGKVCDPSVPDMLRHAHHHHMVYRSRGGKDDPRNVLLLCALCHASVHARDLGISGDANGTLRCVGEIHNRRGWWDSPVPA